MSKLLYGRHYHHIDNGGIAVEVFKEDEQTKLKITTEYFGYPALTSELDITHYLGEDWLKEVGKMLIETSDKIKFKAFL